MFSKSSLNHLILALIVLRTYKRLEIANLTCLKDLTLANMLSVLCSSLLLVCLGRILWLRYVVALANIPGPFLASITSLWRWHLVRKSQFPWTNAALHFKYGPLVRIGPTHVSAASPEAVHAIYVERKGLQKSAIYDIFQPHFEGQPLHNVFSTQDIHYHTSLKRRIGPFYSMASIQTFEGNIDQAIISFISRLRSFAEQSQPVDMSAWLQYYTFDAQGYINFSKPIGFLETGKDFGGFCHLDHEMMVYFAEWGQITELEKLRTWIHSLFKTPETNPLFEFTLKAVRSRLEKANDSNDFLGKLVHVYNTDASKLSLREVLAGVYINIVTGHDVTAIQLRSMVYYIARSAAVQAKLSQEISEAEKAGKLSTPVQYSEAASLTYLSAVIQEAHRIHPSAGLTLERYVPPGGMTLHGQYIPAGTTIGVNGWVMNRDREIFGDDVDVFRPERWLDDTPERIQSMRKTLFTWSTGARACIGENMATLQIYKVMVELYRNFDIALAKPDRDWHVQGGWLTRQTQMEMVLKCH